MSKLRPRKGKKFDCAVRGHRPVTEEPLDKIIIAEKYFVGNLCMHCGCIYYFPNGETRGLIEPA